jgi:hypothetical protein
MARFPPGSEMTESLSQKQKTYILSLSEAGWEEWKKKSRNVLMLLIFKTIAKVILVIAMVTGLAYIIWSDI